MRFTFALVCLAVFATAGTSAYADTFGFTSTPAALGRGGGNGVITAVADPSIAGAFDVTGISGVIDGQAIVGLLPCASYDPNNPCSAVPSELFYDNLLYPSGTGLFGVQILDASGIGFVLSNGADAFFSAYGTHQLRYMTDAFHDNGNAVGITLTPEPRSILLLGTGLLGLAGTVKRRFRRLA